MFKKMKLATKIISGFGLVIAFLVIVGITGYVSMNTTAQKLGIVSNQLEIVKKISNAAQSSQDSQAGSLRFVIYQDDAYVQSSKEDNRKAVQQMQAAKEMMKGQTNRRNSDVVIESADNYLAANTEFSELYHKQLAASKVRAEAAAQVLSHIKNFLDRREQLLEERAQTQGTDQGKIVDYETVTKTLEAQEVRNAYNRVRIGAQKYELAPTPNAREEAAKQWKSEIQNTQRALEQCKAVMQDAESQRHLSETLQVLNDYSDQVQIYERLVAELYDVQVNTLKPAADGLMANIKVVNEGVYDFIADTKEKTDAQVAMAGGFDQRNRRDGCHLRCFGRHFHYP